MKNKEKNTIQRTRKRIIVVGLPAFITYDIWRITESEVSGLKVFILMR